MEEQKKPSQIKEEPKEEKSEKEKRIRAITKMYYSNPKVQEALLYFSQNREVVPRYFEGFGKRPDTLQYQSDIMGSVNRGATSFHCSEEIWTDPLRLSLELSQQETTNLRKSWDLLIDIDSKYLDLSKEAAKLILEHLEKQGISYGLKFSGSKGFHIIVSGKAFPDEFEGMKMKESFPDWPRAITEYLFYIITPEFRKRVGKLMSFKTLEKEEKSRIICKQCNGIALIGALVKLRCPICNFTMERRDSKSAKRRLRCLNPGCAGELEVEEQKEYHYCENCKDSDNEKLQLTSNKYPELFEEMRGELADEHAELDLVLVAPRHLFRMPYSLHEKTSLSSIVLTKEQLDNFSPKDANPFSLNIIPFYPDNKKDEAKSLLSSALNWKKTQISKEEEKENKKYKDYKQAKTQYDNSFIKDVPEEMFPPAIKKLLKGLVDGKKRGLFILITFLRSLNYSPEYINNKVREWNKLNNPPLREGYLKSQVDWHLRQKKQIMPPNYDNDSFYRDLGLIDKKQETKNPIVEVIRKLKAKQANY